MLRHRVTDQQWELVQDLFPPPARTGRPRRDRREILDAILWILRTGAPWQGMPGEFGPWATAWVLFDTWNDDGTLDAILSRLRPAAIDVGLVDRELWCVDGTVIRAARCAAGGGKGDDPEEPEDHALGRSRGGFSTKIHVLCDGHGRPLDFHLTAGQAHGSRTRAWSRPWRTPRSGSSTATASRSHGRSPWPATRGIGPTGSTNT